MASSATHLRAALSFPGFRQLFAAWTISALGDWLYAIVLLVYVFDHTHSVAWVGAANILRILPEALFASIGGVLADRYGRITVMIAADLIRAVLMMALAALVLASGSALVAIALAFLSTLAGTPHRPALQAMVPAVVDEHSLASGNSLLSIADYLTLALGPALGGIIAILGAPWIVFALNAGTFLVSALLLRKLRAPKSSSELPASHESMIAQFLAGVRAITSSSRIAVVVGLIPVLTFIPGTAYALFTAVSQRLLGSGSEGATFLFAAIGAGGVLASGASNRLAQRPRVGSVLLVAMIVFGGSFSAVAFARSAPIAWMILALGGGALVVAEVVVMTLVQRSSPEDVVGRVFGIINSIIFAGITAGSLIAPLLVAAVGLKTTLIVTGMVPGLFAVVAFRGLRGLDEASAHDLDELRPLLDLLGNTGILVGVPASAVEALAKAAEEQDCGPGITIVRQGEAADCLFVVASGNLDVCASARQGDKELVVNKLEAGDYFGEIGLIEQRPRTATVITTTPCRLYRIAGDAFLEAVSQAPVMPTTLMQGIKSSLIRTPPA